jgi:hypothetical protein
VLSLDACRHVYEFLPTTGLDPHRSSSVGISLDPAITYSKSDCPHTVDTELIRGILQANSKLIHLAIWTRPDLAHSASAPERYIHRPSMKREAYLRLDKYLARAMDLLIVYGTHDEGQRLAFYGFSDSHWGADYLDDRKSIGAHVFVLDGASRSWKVKLSATALLSTQEPGYVALWAFIPRTGPRCVMSTCENISANKSRQAM